MTHIHKKIRRHLTKHRAHIISFASLSFAFVLLSGIFLLTRGSTPSTSELAFTERSTSAVGSVIPASCPSNPEHEGTQTCPDGSVISVCSTCPTITCDTYAGYRQEVNACPGDTVGYHIYSCTDGTTREYEVERYATACPVTCDTYAGYRQEVNACPGDTVDYHIYSCTDGTTREYEVDRYPTECPVDGTCGESVYTCNSGRGVELPTEDADSWDWWCGGTYAGGSWGADAWCSVPKPSGCGAGTLNDTCDPCNGNGYSNFPICGPVPDLTADAASPSTAMQGSSVALSATIRNQGDASTGSSFSNFFQVATAANGGGTIADLTSASMSALGAGGSAATSRSYTFTSMGTYSIRACADKSDRNSSGTISESNEVNNCGAWTNVTVYGVTGTLTMPATCTISAPSASCPTTVSWTTQNATSTVTVERAYDPFGTIPGGTGDNGSKKVNFSPVGSYTLNLRHDGRTLDTKTITVMCESNSNWNGNVCRMIPPSVENLMLSGNNTPNGNISFSCAYATTYSIIRDGVRLVKSQSYTGPVNYPITIGGNYTVACERGNMSDTAVLYYDPLPLPPGDLSLLANPRTVNTNKQTTLSWSITSPSTACSLRAEAVCPASGSCADRQSAVTALNSTLTNGTTDANDSYGANRNIQTAVKTIAPENNPTGLKALGKKTFTMTFTTDFVLDCGVSRLDGSTILKKIRVIVSEENEG